MTAAETIHPRSDAASEESPDIDVDVARRLGTRRGMLASVGGSAIARLTVMPLSALLGIVVTRLILDNYGEATYAQYTLLVGIAALLPFADLGLSAAILNAASAAGNPRTDPNFRGVLVSCIRLLACCALVLLTVAVGIYAFGYWDALLGDGLSLDSGALAATLCLAILALNLLVSFGQRILIALGLNTLVVLLGALQTPIVLLVLWLTISAGAGGGYIAVASYAGTFLVSVIAFVVAVRRTSPTIGIAIRQSFSPRVRGERVLNVAWPMLVQMIALPIAMSSDRLVLSHLGSLDDLTEYSLTMQMFGPALGVLTTAGMSLWPVFARARATGTATPFSPHAMAGMFAALALIGGTLIVSLSGWLAELASGGRIHLGWPILVAGAIFIVVQAVKQPYGMALTDPRGLAFQAVCALVLLPVNLGLTISLTPSLGAPGPLIGSIVAVVICQLAPNMILVRQRARRAALVDETRETGVRHQ
ncbi:lipopolysaccharide biosynthesis protein [Microbacterium aquilitoris]|uniref:lipopolysaccharide biosynthesis protein n=1 Tax=Microbacterium aquilitoris TaxID=3067307 RepID=UPI0028915848|nr:polysaccharide biosynthesis protein [Microbacterium sp. KSW2-22]MDT3345476.1 polysaccharide biosynthesis protein [Microbacterium sp. KSW2-22]